MGPVSSENLYRGCGLGNFFTDIIQGDVRFHSRKPLNDMDLLEPVTRALVQQVIQEAATLGISLMVFETYRSQDRQLDLFEQGKSQLHTVGVHHYGLACDLVRDVGGQPSWAGDFSFLKIIARHHKLIWGGDWGTPCEAHKLYDAVHVQRCTVGRQGELFRGEWYPDENYDPYADLDENAPITLMASAEVVPLKPRPVAAATRTGRPGTAYPVRFRTTRAATSAPRGRLVGGAGRTIETGVFETRL